jgi:hypothetical protein
MAGQEASLLFKILADSSQGTAELKKFSSTMKSEVSSLVSSLPGGGALNAFSSEISRASKLATTDLAAATGSTSELKSALLGIAAPAAAGALGIAAVGGAAVGLIGTLFTLTSTVAEAGGKFYDLSLKTGLTVETLSGLDLQLRQSGATIETFSTGVFNLQKNQQAAADGNVKMAATLKALGVTSNDTETATRQLFEGLGKLDEKQRNALGAQVMGKAFQSLSVFVADTNGNIDAVIEESRKMGRLWTGETAQAADKFSDDLIAVRGQLDGITRQIGIQLMPVFQNAITDFSNFLRSNPGEVKEWGKVVVAIVEEVVGSVKELADWLRQIRDWYRSLGSTGPNLPTLPGLPAPPQYSNVPPGFHLGQGSRLVPDNPPPAPGVTVPPGFRLGPGGRLIPLKPGEGASDYLRNTRSTASSFGGGGSSTRTKKPEETADDRGQKLLEQLTEQYKALGIVRESERVQIQLARKEYAGLSAAIKDNIILEAGLIEKKQRDVEADAKRKEGRKDYLTFVQSQIDELHRLTYGEDTATDSLEKQIQKLHEHGVALDADMEHYARFIALSIDVKKHLEDISKYNDLAATTIGNYNPGGQRSTGDPLGDFITNNTPPTAVQALGDPFKGLGKQIADELGLGKEAATAFGDAITTMANGVSQGVGEMVKSFILVGNSGGGFRKMAAEVVASIAAQAAVQSLFQLAQGLAWEALFWFTGKPDYQVAATTAFAAAAMFGLVAGGAALAGRALAGNQFQQGGNGTAAGSSLRGGTSGGSGSGTGTGDNTKVIDTGRGGQSKDEPIRITLDLHHTHEVKTNDEKLGDFISKTVVERVRTGGELYRVIIQGDPTGAHA